MSASPKISPGFFELNLRILSGADVNQLSYMRGEQVVELKQCPDCMKPVIMNLEAILTYEQKSLRHQVEDKMNEIHRRFPKNLNTLANMIEMFTMMKKPVTVLEKKLKDALSDNTNEGKSEKARCLVEKGYVLIMDMHSEVRESLDKKAQDIFLRLHDREGTLETAGQKKACKEAIDLLQIVKKKLFSIPESCTEETKNEQIKSIHYFEKGLGEMERVESIRNQEIPIWKHHLGKAYHRVGSSSQQLSKVSEKKVYLRKAIDMFVCAINDIPASGDENKIYIARSYAYLGHLIETKDKIIKGENESIPESLQTLIINIWENPLLAFEKAMDQSKHDRVVLNRYGMTLNKIQRDQKSEKKYLVRDDHFSTAEKYLKLSIEREETYNWFAYTILMDTYTTKYKCLCDEFEKEEKERRGQSPSPPSKSYLEKALHQGEECLKRKTTLTVLMNMAETHYLMAINPGKRRNIKERVEKQESINKALEYLQRGMEHHQCYSHPRLYALLGKCLFDSGAHDDGIHNMKLAIQTEETKVKDPNNFRDYMQFLLQYYQDAKRKESGRYTMTLLKKRSLLQEAWCMLEEGKKKYNKRLNYPLIGILNKYPHEMMDVLEIVFKFNRGKHTKDLVFECFKHLKKHKAQRVQDRARDLEDRMPNFDRFDDIDEPSDIEQEHGPPEAILSQHKYDFYVCHTQEDETWVRVFLLHTLEKQLQQGNDPVFKGCLRGRDVKRTDVLDSFFKDVHKILFVVSDSFNKDKRCQAELSYAKAHYLMSDRLIPVLKDDSRKPPMLKDVHAADFSTLPHPVANLRYSLCAGVENRATDQQNSEELLYERSESDQQPDDQQITLPPSPTKTDPTDVKVSDKETNQSPSEQTSPQSADTSKTEDATQKSCDAIVMQQHPALPNPDTSVSDEQSIPLMSSDSGFGSFS